MACIVKIVFCTATYGVADFFIRAFTWSKWSHVALLLDDNTVIEATYPLVRRVPLAEMLQHYDKFEIVDISCDYAKTKKAAISQIGKPYDLSAIAGFALHRNWQEQDSWFCSELVAWCLEQGGTKLFKDAYRVTPQHLWMLEMK